MVLRWETGIDAYLICSYTFKYVYALQCKISKLQFIHYIPWLFSEGNDKSFSPLFAAQFAASFLMLSNETMQ